MIPQIVDFFKNKEERNKIIIIEILIKALFLSIF